MNLFWGGFWACFALLSILSVFTDYPGRKREPTTVRQYQIAISFALAGVGFTLLALVWGRW